MAVTPTSELPLINIVTSNYNMEGFLGDTIDSITSQDYTNLDYVIIDAGSSDQSLDIIKDKSSRIHHWEVDKAIGQYDAIIKGFTYSDSEIMGWLNSDDLYFSWTLRSIGEIFNAYPDVDWITSKSHGWVSHSTDAGGANPVPGYSQESFALGAHCFGHPNFRYSVQQESTFWRRSLWNKINYNVMLDYPFAGDYALWLEMLTHTKPYNIEHPLASFRFRTGQRSAAKETYIKDSLKAQKSYQKHFDRLDFTSHKKVKQKYLTFKKSPEKRIYQSKIIKRANISESDSQWIVKDFDIELSIGNEMRT